MTTPRWQKCETPQKVKFLDEAGALRHIERTWRGEPARPYRCPCGYWHVTRKNARKPQS